VCDGQSHLSKGKWCFIKSLFEFEDRYELAYYVSDGYFSAKTMVQAREIIVIPDVPAYTPPAKKSSCFFSRKIACDKGSPALLSLNNALINALDEVKGLKMKNAALEGRLVHIQDELQKFEFENTMLKKEIFNLETYNSSQKSVFKEEAEELQKQVDLLNTQLKEQVEREKDTCNALYAVIENLRQTQMPKDFVETMEKVQQCLSCPITFCPFADPLITATGHVFEYETCARISDEYGTFTCPMTRQRCYLEDLRCVRVLRELVDLLKEFFS
jgi:hypothetical protein